MTELPAQRIFHFQSDGFPRGKLDTIEVSAEDYDIYVRQICIQEVTQHFMNCPPGSLADSLTRVEVQYLLKNIKTNRIIYITNYPDQYEELIAHKVFNIEGGIVNLNPWYFSKFYIGTYDDAEKKIVFKKSAEESITIGYSTSADTIFFDQLKIPARSKSMDMNAALQPSSAFVRQAGFKWLFRNADKNKEGIPLLQDAIYISKKKPLKGVFFRLSKQWDAQPCCFIYYRFKRLVTQKF